MLIVVDACALSGELVRKRGRRILDADSLAFCVADHALAETERRLALRRVEMKAIGRLGDAAVDGLIDTALDVLRTCIQTVPREMYAHLETTARRRVPADPKDWPTVAAALLLDGAIWTEDRDFFGCGCAVWRTETLLAEVEATMGRPRD